MTLREFLWRDVERIFVEEEYASIIGGFMDNMKISYDLHVIEMPDEKYGCICEIYSAGNGMACKELVKQKLDKLRRDSKTAV